MVARINTSENLGTILDYNEKKVLQNAAELIYSRGFLTDPARLDISEKLDRFRRLNELNNRAEENMLHATLNFDPAERLSKQQLTDIAHRYMTGLQMQDQPYLVYQHHDAGHPHVHIVSSLIQQDGKKIATHNIAMRLSEPTRKAIEQEFQLVRAHRHEPTKETRFTAAEVPRAKYGEQTKQAMRDILQMIGGEYNFTNFEEYNAILRQYNVLADRGKQGSKTYENGGLVYRVTDENGKKKSAPVKASAYSFKPTLPNLEKLFIHNQQTRDLALTELRQKIDLALFQAPASQPELKADLEKKGIVLIQRPGQTGHPPETIYVDHQLKIAVDARQLGSAYTHEQLQKLFDQQFPSRDIQQNLDQGKRPSR